MDMMDKLQDNYGDVGGYQGQLAGFVPQSRDADEKRMGLRVVLRNDLQFHAPIKHCTPS